MFGVFVFKQKTAYDMRISDWSSDVCSSDLMPLLWGNPHFPWSGTERLYLAHLTIPGRFDIMGASLYGLPAVLIGFNDHFAWSHTVSTDRKSTRLNSSH